jgi:hypothetical protein
MPKETNPQGLSDFAVSFLVSENRCPMCLGTLQALICEECKYDANPWINLSRARHDRAHNNREG